MGRAFGKWKIETAGFFSLKYSWKLDICSAQLQNEGGGSSLQWTTVFLWGNSDAAADSVLWYFKLLNSSQMCLEEKKQLFLSGY